MRKTSEETVRFIVELLLSEWTPQEVADCLAELREGCHTLPGSPDALSVATVQRIAKEWGIARSVGARPGVVHRQHQKWSPHREQVKQLRSAGHSLRVIAGLVGLRSPQQVANLLDDN